MLAAHWDVDELKREAEEKDGGAVELFEGQTCLEFD